MAYKISLLLSSVFLMFLFLLSCDLICVSQIHSTLNSLATTVGYMIAKEGRVSKNIMSILNANNAQFEMDYVPSISIGTSVSFVVKKEYTPLIMSKDTMVISVRHSTIVGYYDSYYQ